MLDDPKIAVNDSSVLKFKFVLRLAHPALFTFLVKGADF
jgi:hypothetical protein